MKKYYEVVQNYYNNVIVITNSFIVYADKKPDAIFESTKTYDICKKYFVNPVEAEKFRQKMLSAHRKDGTKYGTF